MYANVPITDTGKIATLFVYKHRQIAGEVGMKTRNRERYKELSEHAVIEDDPKKLRQIANEINRILKAELNRLKKRSNQA